MIDSLKDRAKTEALALIQEIIDDAPKLNIEIPFLSSLSKLLDGEIPVEEAVRTMVASYQN